MGRRTFISYLSVTLVALILSGTSKASDLSAGTFLADGCELKEPIYDYVFNLTGLSSDFPHKIGNELGGVEFNVCGSVIKDCGDRKDVGACLTRKDGKKYVLGKTSKLHYTNGRMYFEFLDGEKCSSDKNYTLYLTLSCDYTVDQQQLTIVPTDDPDCTFYIKWETPLACLPLPASLKRNECSIVDEKTNHTFDLMPLSDWNYRVFDRNGSMFIINVCKPVLYGEKTMCPGDSGVCFVDNNASNIKHKYLNYGIAQSKPIFENGQLVMKFPSPTKCNDKQNYTSIIYFTCYPDAKREMLDFAQQNGCNFEFTWLTTRACNAIMPCTAMNPVTGKTFDFNSIANVYNVTQDDKHYVIGICKEVGSQCSDKDAGACEIINNKSTSLGKSNLQIYLNQTGSPYAMYTSGSNCENSQIWMTKIEFICSSSSDQGPKIIENSKCQLIIHFRTILACTEKILCKTTNGDSTIDLTPLISSEENYVAEVNATALKLINSNSVKYYLNVCRPLVSQYGLSCPGGSAACKAVVEGSGTPEQEQSLGYFTSSIGMVGSKVELKYVDGGICPDNGSEKMSTRIDFVCDQRAGKGRPILQSILNKCHYKFEWPTSVICPSEEVNFNADTCTMANQTTGRSFNFRNATFTKNGTIEAVVNPNSFEVNICEPNRTFTVDYIDNAVNMFFISNRSCGDNGFQTVHARFVCAESSKVILHDSNLCNIMLTQETSEICKFLGLPAQNILATTTKAPITTTGAPITTTGAPITTTKTTVTKTPTPGTTATLIRSTVSQPNTATDLHPSDSKSQMVTIAAAIITISMVALVVVSIVCLRDPNKRMVVKSFFRRNSPLVLYRRVNTGEEANLLLTQNQQMIDSDDDLIL